MHEPLLRLFTLKADSVKYAAEVNNFCGKFNQQATAIFALRIKLKQL